MIQRLKGAGVKGGAPEMRNLIAVALWLGLLATVRLTNAQEQPSKFELYGGYYHVRFNIDANLPGVAGGGINFKVQATFCSSRAGRVLRDEIAQWSQQPREQSADRRGDHFALRPKIA